MFRLIYKTIFRLQLKRCFVDTQLKYEISFTVEYEI